MGEDKNNKNSNSIKINTSKNLKEFFKSAISVVLVATTLGTSIVIGGKKLQEKVYDNRSNRIASTYGKPSAEYLLTDYIKAALRLYYADLDKYEMSDAVINQLFDYGGLASPDAIMYYLDIFDENKNASKGNLDKQFELMQAVAFLKNQGPRLFDYVRKTGYEIASNDLLSAIKEYAGEVYNVNPDDIKLYYSETSNGPALHIIVGDNNLKTKSGNTLGLMEKYTIFTEKSSEDLPFPAFCTLLIKALDRASDIKKDINEKDLYRKSSERALKGNY